MRLNKSSNKNKYSFLGEKDLISPVENEKKAPVEKETVDSNQPMFRNAKSIISTTSHTENINNVESNNTKFGLEGRNSIFDTNLIDDKYNKKSSREITQENKDKIKDKKDSLQRKFEESKMPKQSGSESELNLSKKSSEFESSKVVGRYGIPNASISIFDKGEFDRVKPTDGEKINKREAKKDDSWKDVKKNNSTNNITKNLFDSLFDQ